MPLKVGALLLTSHAVCASMLTWALCHQRPGTSRRLKSACRDSVDRILRDRFIDTSQVGQLERRELTMKAEVGDWLVVTGTTVEQRDQRGEITEVRSPDGSPPYVVPVVTHRSCGDGPSRTGCAESQCSRTGSC
jgi:Domain of unknown function (DUF1918)